jgi:hypothetical protein
VLYLRLIILSVGCDILVDSEVLLVTDFVNLKIKLAQSFGGAHRDRVCMCVLIGVSACTCMSIYVCTVFLKKIRAHFGALLERDFLSQLLFFYLWVHFGVLEML